jgi:hypothetical protein
MTTIPGFTPDYTALIQNDPGYQSFLAANQAGSVQDRAGLKAARQRAVTQFGVVPDFASLDPGLVGPDLETDIDAATQAAAKSNPYSVAANLASAHTNAVRNLKNQLAARGMLGSGEAGFQLQNENTAFGQGNYNATNKLLDYIGGANSSFASAEQQRQQAAAQARQQAATFEAGLPQNQPQGSQTANFSHVDVFGNPVYVTPNGQQYGADAKPYGGTPTSPTETYGTSDTSPVPGYSPAVTNSNLATYLFGDPYNQFNGF